MFHATLDSSKTWKQIVDALATLLTEVNFVVNKKGITLTQLDSSKVAMIDLTLPAGVFQEFNCEEEMQICLGVDELTKISRRMAADDRLEFDVDDDKRFEIRMIGQAERLFRLQMLTPPDNQAKRPDLKFMAKLEMNSDALKQAVKDIGVISNHIKVTADKKSVTFAGEGDTGEAEVQLTTGEDSVIYDLESKEKATAMYALNYLSEIVKAVAADTVRIQFSSDKPMRMDFGIAEAGSISFVLAPRIERR
ncbi:proliferating cell nuclear antigen (pcna) [Candidatus Thorarchaeota archaeon]|nr:MAG: proliferating cell nuclear antigen (pcna) [Candidatus Thorarchaeota archaeon]